MQPGYYPALYQVLRCIQPTKPCFIPPRMNVTEDVSVPSSGFSFISLVTSNENAFHKTVTFYTELGFVEISVYDRASPGHHRLVDHCINSEKETWLVSRGDGDVDGTNLTLKVRLVADAGHSWKDGADGGHQQLVFTSSHDWRGSNKSWVFYIPQMQTILEILQKKHIAFECYPNETEPVEVYAHDPLGTLVGFTRRTNPFTSNISKLGAKNILAGIPRANSPQTSQDGSKKRIGVLTSGGDAPGMNSAVRAVVRMTIAKGCEAYAIFEGYEGMVKGGEYIKRMTWEDVRGWLSEGGTLIGTARCEAFRKREGRLASAKNLILNGIDALVVCGGDGSLTGADIFRSEWPGLLDELVKKNELTHAQIKPYMRLNIVGLVGSIDNDMTGTDATIGCYSSLTRICQAIDYIDATAYSHSRAFVIEVMGRHCGWLALMAGVSTGADYVFLPEKAPTTGWEEQMCRIISKVSWQIPNGE
jgi:6-phosphofructokinase 1